jgi:hypothetical protein
VAVKGSLRVYTYVAPAKKSSLVFLVKLDRIRRKTTSDNVIITTRTEELDTERQMAIGSNWRRMITKTISVRATLPINGVEEMNTCGSLDKFGYASCNVRSD